jgi:hypothetical protein
MLVLQLSICSGQLASMPVCKTPVLRKFDHHSVYSLANAVWLKFIQPPARLSRSEISMILIMCNLIVDSVDHVDGCRSVVRTLEHILKQILDGIRGRDNLNIKVAFVFE